MMEAEWQRSQHVPTVEEYMTNAIVSFALAPIVLPALYFCLYESKTMLQFIAVVSHFSVHVWCDC